MKTDKRSGTAAPNGPKTEPKRSSLGAEKDASKSGKKSLWPSLGKAMDRSHRDREQAWAAPKTRPQSEPFKTAKHGNGPKMHQKRSRVGAENGTSETRKQKAWQSFGKATDRSQRAREQAWAALKTRPQRTVHGKESVPFCGRRCMKRSASEAALAQRLGQGFGTCLMSGKGLWHTLDFWQWQAVGNAWQWRVLLRRQLGTGSADT